MQKIKLIESIEVHRYNHIIYQIMSLLKNLRKIKYSDQLHVSD